MIAKNTSLAVAAVLGFAINANAEDTKTYKTLQISCNPFANNNLVGCNLNSQSIAESEKIVAQSRRGGKRGVRSKGKIDGYYGGFNLGIGFPNGGVGLSNDTGTEFPDAEYGNGFVGSVFGGIKFSRNFSADIEFLLGLGGLDADELNDFVNDPINNIDIEGTYEADGDYSGLAVYLNPRFELPLTQSDRFSLYLSPGIGITQTNVNFNAEDDSNEFFDDNDSSSTGFAYQVKGGASYSFNRRTGVFGQLRYASLAADEDVDDINIFSVETGLKFSF